MVHLIFNGQRLTAALLASVRDDDLVVLNLGVILSVPQKSIKCPAVTLGAAGIDGAKLYELIKARGGKVKSYF